MSDQRLPEGLDHYPEVTCPQPSQPLATGPAQLITVHDSSILDKTGLDRCNPRSC